MIHKKVHPYVELCADSESVVRYLIGLLVLKLSVDLCFLLFFLTLIVEIWVEIIS
jgi:hypothetical protein